MIATCDKCGAWAVTGPDAATGKTLGADIVPVDRQGYIAALTAGVPTYDLTTAPGGAQKLRIRRLGSPAPGFDSNGAQNGAQRVLRHHGCAGATYTAAKKPPGASQGPKAHATRGEALGGNHPATAPAVASPPSCPAGRASHRRSDLARTGLGAPESIPGVPGHPTTPLRPSETARHDEKGQACPPSPTASAARPGQAPVAPTAPGVTRRSAPTWSVTSTGSAPSALTAAAQTLAALGSSTVTASGAARRPTQRFAGRCTICDRLIKPGEPYTGIQCGTFNWAAHEECP